MSADNNPRISCPSCKHLNEAGYSFCSNCGSPSSAAPLSGQMVNTVRLRQDMHSEYIGQMDKKVSQTMTGLLLLIIGLLLGWIPYILYIGGILELIGVILIIIGRDAFGVRHGKYVIYAVVIYVTGFAAEFILGFSFGVTIASATLGGVTPHNALATIMQAFESLLWGSLVVSAVLGISTVMLVYQLEEANGRMLLWVAFAAQIAAGTAGIIIIGPLISHAIALAFASSPPDLTPILNLDNELTSLRILNAIPSVIFAFAYYLAWKRIKPGIISRSETPQMP